MITLLYRLYQIFVGVPVVVIMTIITAIEVGIGTTIGNGHYWGYYPGRWWAKVILWVLLIPVKVEGREHLEKGRSYVFVANHQGIFDIFLIYGHLGRNFKWMMKHQLGRIPFIGYACRKSHQIFVDKSGPKKIKKTYDTAREILQEGYSVVPLTINGSFDILPRTRGFINLINWHPLRLTIHEPIHPIGKGPENV